MTDLSLRERLASYNIHGPVAGAAEQAILEWLVDNGLALVPVGATTEMLVAGGAAIPQNEKPEQSYYGTVSWAHDAYDAMLKAAPPAADLLKGKSDEQG